MITQSYDTNQANNISVTIKSSKIDQELMDWILSTDKEAKSGQIIITDGESGKTSKTITFTDLKASSYTENMYNNGAFNINIQPTTSFSMHFKTVNIKF
ncbi:type VI secretion system tube protein TssD [Mucilaginibacter sp.]|uniref:type VI secretion system tube protein TssD n=1 Tax=Mucilaginibacter sp. TaxID=1882438 RepID=UPI00261C849B|nr:type VI secretion system tube protein TssD [Mucilaginibacter sp.]